MAAAASKHGASLPTQMTKLDNDPASAAARPSALAPSKAVAPPQSVYDPKEPCQFAGFFQLPNVKAALPPDIVLPEQAQNPSLPPYLLRLTLMLLVRVHAEGPNLTLSAGLAVRPCAVRTPAWVRLAEPCACLHIGSCGAPWSCCCSGRQPNSAIGARQQRPARQRGRFWRQLAEAAGFAGAAEAAAQRAGGQQL